MAYWFNVDTGTVETEETRSQGAFVMGPYDSADEAAHALELAHEKSEKWDEEDRRWNEGEDKGEDA
jgi:phenylalanine-4-hydroxylase